MPTFIDKSLGALGDVTKSAWSALPTPSAALAGMKIFCTNYPGPQGGALLVCTGSRWVPVSQQHCLMNYHNGETGLVVAAGAAEALFGVARAIHPGMLMPGDNLKLAATTSQSATSNNGSRALRLRSAATEAELLTGSLAGLAGVISTTNISHVTDKGAVILTNTAGRTATINQISAGSGASALQSTALADLSAAGYFQFSFGNLSDQPLTVLHAALYVEFGS